MKILFVVPGLDLGGTEKFVVNLSRHFSTVHEIKIICLSNKKYFYENLANSNIEVLFINLKNLLLLPFSLFKLFNFFRKHQVDIVQTFLYSADLIGGLLAYIAGTKNIYWAVRHGSLTNLKKNKIYNKILVKILVIASKKIPVKILFNSETSLLWHESIGYPKEKVAFIPNPIPQWVADHKFSNFFIPRTGNSLKMGMAASFTSYKGHELALRAVNLISDKYPIKISFCGRGTEESGPLHKYIQAKFSEIIHLCEFHGPLNESSLVNWFLDLNLYLSVSTVEGFPNSLAEACSLGLPAIATDVGESKTIIGSSEFIVSPTPTSIFLAVENIIENSDQDKNFYLRRRHVLLKKYESANIFRCYEKEWSTPHN